MAFLDSLKRIFGGRQNGDAASAGPAAVSCEEALRKVHEFIDGELDGSTHSEVEAHFEMCKQCYPHLRLERRFRDALRRACGEETAPAPLREQVLDLVSRGDDGA